jgi:3-oxoacyl-[acyl-carrier protein] reductase
MSAVSLQRVALITGCGKAVGIGSATARLLAANGIAVAVSDIEERGAASDNEPESTSAWNGLEKLVAEIRGNGGTAMSVRGDVSSEADTSRIVKDVLDWHGRLDILVNNAAAPHGLDRGDIEKVPVNAWDRVMAINARGVFLMCRAAVPIMRGQGWGRIVNISSVAAMQAFPYRGAYSASKAAVIGLTRSLALDVAASGVTVNAVCPGSVLTTRAMSTAKRVGSLDIEAGLARRALDIPMKRHGDVAEVASVIAFLASDAGSYMTGQALVVDGGGLPPG